jgi:hypothetical protein
LRNVRRREDLAQRQVHDRQGTLQRTVEKLKAQKGRKEVELSNAQAAWDYVVFTLTTEHNVVTVESKGRCRIGNPCLDLTEVPFTMLTRC